MNINIIEYLKIVDKFEEEMKKELDKVNLGNNSTDVYMALDRALLTMEAEVTKMNYPSGV